jgi:hypothetical protein
MPIPQAARPVASIASMMKVFQTFDIIFGEDKPVPFDRTWLEWIHIAPLSRTVKKIVASVVANVNELTLVPYPFSAIL